MRCYTFSKMQMPIVFDIVINLNFKCLTTIVNHLAKFIICPFYGNFFYPSR